MSDTWEITILAEVLEDDFSAFPQKIQEKIKKKIFHLLADNPYYGSAYKGDLEGYYKIKWESFRIVYTVVKESKKIVITAIRPRDIIYDRDKEMIRKRISKYNDPPNDK